MIPTSVALSLASETVFQDLMVEMIETLKRDDIARLMTEMPHDDAIEIITQEHTEGGNTGSQSATLVVRHLPSRKSHLAIPFESLPKSSRSLFCFFLFWIKLTR